MKNLGRGPTECEIKKRPDSLKRRGVLAPTPEVIAYCYGEKAGAGGEPIFGRPEFRRWEICASRLKIIGH